MTLRSEENPGIADDGARYGEMLAIGEDLDGESYGSGGFNSGVVPVIRLNIGTGPVSTNNILDAANIIEISPNPADNKINLNIDLVETVETANIRILDVNGRLVYDRQYKDIRTESITLDISSYAPGTYFLHFITKEGVRTKRFIVQH